MKKYGPVEFIAEERPKLSRRKNPIGQPEDEFTVGQQPGAARKRRGSMALAALMCAFIVAGCLYAGNAYSASSSGGLVISEVVSSNSGSLTGSDGDSPDWIELHNRTASDLSLSGCSIVRKLTDERISLGDITIPAGGYIIVYAAGEALGETPCTGFTLSKNGETLYLIDSSGAQLQQLIVPALGADVSYARFEGSGYAYCLYPTPGAANNTAGETIASLQERAQAACVTITEVMPDSQAGGWVELFNSGETAADLNLFCLADNSDDASLCRLPDATLEPGEYVLVHTEGSGGGLTVPLSFGRNDRGAYLYDITGELRSALTWRVLPGSGASVVGNDACTKEPTPGAENSGSVFCLSDRAAMDDADPVRFSEVLVKNEHSIPDADGMRCAWAEVHNRSDKAVPLLGYYLSDDADDPFKWALPEMALPPGGYAVVFLSGSEGGGDMLQASFSLGRDEDMLYLTDISTMRTDAMKLPASVDDVSVGRSPDGAPCYYACPSPGSANEQGYTLLADALCSRAQGVYISEVCACGENGDWIEIFNGSDAVADLSGWYLSDDPDDPFQWRIPSLTIEAGGYAVINAGGASDADAPFGISIEGETIVLSNAGGALVDAIATGVLRSGMTSGRAEGSATLSRSFFLVPTPGSPNSSHTSTGYAAAPMFSQSGLYHSDAFTLSISSPAEDAVIYYTLDGSVPGENDRRYTAPITIERNTVVRAAALAPGLMPSDVVTATYLFEEPHTVPVFCLSGEPSEIHIIFHKANRRYKPMYPGNVEYYETDGTLGVSFTAGIKPKGRSSLDLGQNSVTFRLREQYGRCEVTYPFFENGGVTSFTELTLRNSGEDRIRSRLRDSFFHVLAEDMNIATIRTRIVAVYINGEYWGMYDLTEEQEEGYFEAYFGLSNEDIDMIDRNNTVMEGSVDDYLRVREYARTWNLADDAVFAEFEKLVDTDACIDYLILNTYFGNGDVINQRFWHARDNSVRWQPLLFDLDWCMRFNQSDRETFTRYFNRNGAVAVNATVTNMDIFWGLKQNAAWREKFIDRFIELAYTQFDTDRLLALLDEMVTEMRPEMVRHIAKWHTHRSVDAWIAQTEGLREALIVRRDIALKQMARAFGLSDAALRARVDAFLSSR